MLATRALKTLHFGTFFPTIVVLLAFLPAQVHGAFITTSGELAVVVSGDRTGVFGTSGLGDTDFSGAVPSVGFSVTEQNLLSTGDAGYIDAETSAQAAWGGLLRAFARAQGHVPGSTIYRSQSSAFSALDENIVFQSPMIPNGTPGIATGSMTVHALLTTRLLAGFSDTSSMNGAVDFSFDLNIGPVGNESFSEHIEYATGFEMRGGQVTNNRVVTDNGSTIVEDSNSFEPLDFLVAETLDFQIPIIFGSPTRLRTQLSMSAGASATGLGDRIEAIGNGSNTAAWGGISSLRLDDGTLVTDFTAFGETSGFNYANPALQQASAVSEPASLTLLGMGTLGMFGFGWRRKRKADRCF